MAKKKRKSTQPNLPQETLDRAEAQASGRWVAKPRPQPEQAAEPSTTAAASTPPAPASTKKAVDLRREYAYVVDDLRRIGVLAAIILVALAVLKILVV